MTATPQRFRVVRSERDEKDDESRNQLARSGKVHQLQRQGFGVHQSRRGRPIETRLLFDRTRQ